MYVDADERAHQQLAVESIHETSMARNHITKILKSVSITGRSHGLQWAETRLTNQGSDLRPLSCSTLEKASS